MALIRKLFSWESRLIEQHLLRLDEHDRRMRFCSPVPPSAIPPYVAQIDWTRDRAYGFFENGTLRGLAELKLDRPFRPRTAEAAFSVESSCRRRGVAARLMETILAVSVTHRLEGLFMVMLCENLPMREIARKSGFLLSFDEADVYAVARIAETEPTRFARRIVAACEAMLPLPAPAWTWAGQPS